MKRIRMLFLIITCSISFSSLVGQSMNYPSWIKGTWQNSLVSDTHMFVFWTFAKDSIFIENGLHLNANERKCLAQEYVGYKKTEFSDDTLYRLTFSKGKDIIVYEFKLIKDDDYGKYIDKPVFTYSLTINGIRKVEHSISAHLKFFKK